MRSYVHGDSSLGPSAFPELLERERDQSAQPLAFSGPSMSAGFESVYAFGRGGTK
jgi:hypothetical protein